MTEDRTQKQQLLKQQSDKEFSFSVLDKGLTFSRVWVCGGGGATETVNVILTFGIGS